MSQPVHVLRRESGGLFVCDQCPEEFFLDYDDHDKRLMLRSVRRPVIRRKSHPVRDPMEEN